MKPDVVVGFANGEPDAVRAVYNEYGKVVYAVAYRALGDRSLAEEATQETFVRAWRGRLVTTLPASWGRFGHHCPKVRRRRLPASRAPGRRAA